MNMFRFSKSVIISLSLLIISNNGFTFEQKYFENLLLFSENEKTTNVVEFLDLVKEGVTDFDFILKVGKF